MYAPRSSNSLLLIIRLFALATISSTMAPPAGAVRIRRDPATESRARAMTWLVAVFARVIEGKHGAVDMDFSVLLQIGDVALERLLSLLAEEVHLEPALHVADVGVLRLHLAHQLEDQKGPGVLQDRADLARRQLEGSVPDLARQLVLAVRPRLPLVRGHRAVPSQGLELGGLLGKLGGQPLGQALIIDQDLAQDNRARDARGLRLFLEVVVDLARRHLNLAQDRPVLHLLEDETLAHLLPEGLLAFSSGHFGLAFAYADLAQVVADLRLRHGDFEPLRGAQEDLLLDHLVEEPALDGVRLLGVIVLGIAGVVRQVALVRLQRDRNASDRGDRLGVEHRLRPGRSRCRGGGGLGRGFLSARAGGHQKDQERRRRRRGAAVRPPRAAGSGTRQGRSAADPSAAVILGSLVFHLSSVDGPTAVVCEAAGMLSPARIDFKRSRTAAMRHWSTAGRIVPGEPPLPSSWRRRTPEGRRLSPERLEARRTRDCGSTGASSAKRIWTRPPA